MITTMIGMPDNRASATCLLLDLDVCARSMEAMTSTW